MHILSMQCDKNIFQEMLSQTISFLLFENFETSKASFSLIIKGINKSMANAC